MIHCAGDTCADSQSANGCPKSLDQRQVSRYTVHNIIAASAFNFTVCSASQTHDQVEVERAHDTSITPKAAAKPKTAVKAKAIANPAVSKVKNSSKPKVAHIVTKPKITTKSKTIARPRAAAKSNTIAKPKITGNNKTIINSAKTMVRKAAVSKKMAARKV